ncbi:DUF3987 domain-containing protein [Shewanella mangrovisoli]|uniref:DUF3987 domain-containing protein n=1 Tax=Shewanella mangrovisoli TaxID=2864211 RepID=UPI0035B98614
MVTNNMKTLSVVKACPQNKRTIVHEVMMLLMGESQSFNQVRLVDANGAKIAFKEIKQAKVVFIRPCNTDQFFVKAIWSKGDVDLGLEEFAYKMKRATYCYKRNGSLVAVFCCEGSKDDRNQLKFIKDSLPSCELIVSSKIRLRRSGIALSSDAKVLTIFEVANQVEYEGWLEPKSFENVSFYAKEINEKTIPSVLLKMAKSIGVAGNNNLDYLVSTNIGLISTILTQDFRVSLNKNAPTAYAPNIWSMNVGHPATGKTPAMQMSFESAASCMYRRDENQERKEEMVAKAIERRLKNHLNKTLSDDEVDMYLPIDVIEKECEQKLLSIVPKSTKNRGVYMTTDTTLPALYQVMTLGCPIAYMGDEGGAFLKGLEGKNSVSSAMRAVFLNSESGTGHLNVSRATKNDKLIKNAVVSVTLGIQPDVLAPFINNAHAGIGNDGLLNRFQFMVLPVTAFMGSPLSSYCKCKNTSGGFSRLKPITSKKFFDALAMWDPKRESNYKGDHLVVYFSSKAEEEYYKWLVYLKSERSKYSPKHLMHSQIGKYEVLACKLGLIYQVALNYDPNKQSFLPVNEISVKAFEFAKNSIDYLMSHAKTIFGGHGEGLALQEQAKSLLDRLKKKAINNKFMTISEMAQCNWKNFSGRGGEAKEAISDALYYLEKYGVVKPIDKNGKRVWHLNPTAIWW